MDFKYRRKWRMKIAFSLFLYQEGSKLEKKTNSKIPQTASEYVIKFVFDNKSENDVNEILKECFINEVRDKNIIVNHSI